MLCGEVNENGEKTTIRSNQQNSKFARAAHFSVYISLPLFCTTYNVKLSGYLFYGGNIVRVFVHFFDGLSFSPWWPLAFLIFPSAATKIFMLFFQQKNFPQYFISRSSCLLLFFSLSFAGLSPTFSFYVSLSVLQLCRHDK